MKENHFLLNAGARSKIVWLALTVRTAADVRAAPWLVKYSCPRGEKPADAADTKRGAVVLWPR